MSILNLASRPINYVVREQEGKGRKYDPDPVQRKKTGFLAWSQHGTLLLHHQTATVLSTEEPEETCLPAFRLIISSGTEGLTCTVYLSGGGETAENLETARPASKNSTVNSPGIPGRMFQNSLNARTAAAKYLKPGSPR